MPASVSSSAVFGLEAASARVSYAASDRLLELFAAEIGANGLGIDLALTQSDGFLYRAAE